MSSSWERPKLTATIMSHFLTTYIPFIQCQLPFRDTDFVTFDLKNPRSVSSAYDVTQLEI